MTSSKQSAKRVRQNEQARVRNKEARSAMKSAMKRVLKAETPEAAQKVLPEAMRRIDKAGKHHVIHKNAAARLKSRISRAAAKSK